MNMIVTHTLVNPVNARRIEFTIFRSGVKVYTFGSSKFTTEEDAREIWKRFRKNGYVPAYELDKPKTQGRSIINPDLARMLRGRQAA